MKYQAYHSQFHRLDPLSKIVWLLCVSVLGVYFVDAASQSMLLVIVVITAFIAAKFTPVRLWKMMRLPVLLGLPYFIIQLLFYPGETEWMSFGPVVITYEALNFAAAIVMRLLILVLASMIMIVTTDPRDLVLAFAQKLRVPYRLAFAISIALQFIPILEGEAVLIREAQRLRGQGIARGLRAKIAWHVRFMKAVFIAAVRRVEQIATTMELKGFGRYDVRTYRREIVIPVTGYLLAMSSVCLTFMTIILI